MSQAKLDNLTEMLVEDILNTTDEDILKEAADDCPLSSVQIAYALLWRSDADCGLVHTARRVLLGALSHDEQRKAVAWVIASMGPMTTQELIAADMRTGVFPRRSVPE
jgi:hypothetical protein